MSERVDLDTTLNLAKRMERRRQEVDHLTEEAGTKLQFLHFDTHNSSKGGNAHPLNSKDRVRIKPLCAKLHLGDFLEGSAPDVQTMLLKKDLQEFSHFLSDQNLGTDEEKRAVYRAIKKLEEAESLAILTSVIVDEEKPTRKEALFAELSTQLRGKLEALRPGESLMIPSGYTPTSPRNLAGKGAGHMIALEVRRTQNDSYTIAIFNTGEGLELMKNTRGTITPFHYPGDRAKENHYRYQPAVFEDAHLDHFNKEFFEKLFAATKADNVGALYEVVATRLGRHIDFPDQKVYRPYQEQGDIGSCAKKSLQVWLHQEMADVEDGYRLFRAFRLQKALVDITRAKAAGSIRFRHSLARWGGTRKTPTLLEFVVSLLSRLVALLKGEKRLLSVKIRPSTVDKLLERAHTVVTRRIFKPNA